MCLVLDALNRFTIKTKSLYVLVMYYSFQHLVFREFKMYAIINYISLQIYFTKCYTKSFWKVFLSYNRKLITERSNILESVYCDE